MYVFFFNHAKHTRCIAPCAECGVISTWFPPLAAFTDACGPVVATLNKFEFGTSYVQSDSHVKYEGEEALNGEKSNYDKILYLEQYWQETLFKNIWVPIALRIAFNRFIKGWTKD